MSFVTTKAKFHLALDAVGLVLQGAPDRPAYQMKNAPVYGNRFASGDRDYNDLSQWWYLTQTDWSGGFKDTFPYVDDAKFYYSSNIDARTKPGTFRLERQLSLVRTEDAEVRDVKLLSIGGSSEALYIKDKTYILSSGAAKFTSGTGTSEFLIAHNGSIWDFGTVVIQTNAVGASAPIDQTAFINTVINGSISSATLAVGVGGTLYIFGRSNTNYLFCVKTAVASPASAADYTLVFETPIPGTVVGGELLGTKIPYLVSNAGQWQLYSLDTATDISTLTYTFDGGIAVGIYGTGSRYVRKLREKLLITILRGSATTEGKGDIYTYDGSTLTKIYSTDEVKFGFAPTSYEAIGFLRGGATIHGKNAYWGNLVYDGTYMHNWIKDFGDEIAVATVPIGNNSTDLVYVADLNITSGSDDQELIYSYAPDGSTYKDGANSEAFLVFNQHDRLQSIDKLMNSVNIGFEALASGQEIKVYYTTSANPTPAIGGWTLLGSATYAIDGASVTFKNLPFTAGVTAKKMWFRINLVGGGSNTPAVTDFTLEYLPMPDYKKQWTINANLADDVKRPDGELVELVGRELKGRLERAWWTKSQLDFQDLDYATTAVNDASFEAADTTITVDNTYDFPEQGRIRIEDEEITYTGKTPTTFTGCTRGARGTRAASHADDSVVNNAYKVIITDIEQRVATLLEDKNLEYTMGISLREV
jgi:hypothetical protein